MNSEPGPQQAFNRGLEMVSVWRETHIDMLLSGCFIIQCFDMRLEALDYRHSTDSWGESDERDFLSLRAIRAPLSN